MSKSKIEENIELRVYYTGKNASHAVKLSKLPPKEKKRLLNEVIPAFYTEVSSELEVPATKTPNGDHLHATSTFGRDVKNSELDTHLLRIALQILGLAVKHRLSREQVFDMVKERMIAGID